MGHIANIFMPDAGHTYKLTVQYIIDPHIEAMQYGQPISGQYHQSFSSFFAINRQIDSLTGLRIIPSSADLNSPLQNNEMSIIWIRYVMPSFELRQ